MELHSALVVDRRRQAKRIAASALQLLCRGKESQRIIEPPLSDRDGREVRERARLAPRVAASTELAARHLQSTNGLLRLPRGERQPPELEGRGPAARLRMARRLEQR